MQRYAPFSAKIVKSLIAILNDAGLAEDVEESKLWLDWGGVDVALMIAIRSVAGHEIDIPLDILIAAEGCLVSENEEDEREFCRKMIQEKRHAS